MDTKVTNNEYLEGIYEAALDDATVLQNIPEKNTRIPGRKVQQIAKIVPKTAMNQYSSTIDNAHKHRLENSQSTNLIQHDLTAESIQNRAQSPGN